MFAAQLVLVYVYAFSVFYKFTTRLLRQDLALSTNRARNPPQSSALQFSTAGGVLRFTARGPQSDNQPATYDWTEQLTQPGPGDWKEGQQEEEAVYETLTNINRDRGDSVLQENAGIPPRLPPRSDSGHRIADFPVAYEQPKTFDIFREFSAKRPAGKSYGEVKETQHSDNTISFSGASHFVLFPTKNCTCFFTKHVFFLKNETSTPVLCGVRKH